jgi:hypothetical protein
MLKAQKRRAWNYLNVVSLLFISELLNSLPCTTLHYWTVKGYVHWQSDVRLGGYWSMSSAKAFNSK